MKKLAIITLFLPLLFAGCASATGPTDTKASNRVSLRDAAALSGGAGVGALAGDAVGGKKGALIGGVVGATAAALINNASEDKNATALAEAKEQGRREAQKEMFDKLWVEQVERDAAQNSSASGKAARPVDAPVRYPAQTVEGVRLTPRVSSAQGLTEPSR